MTTSPRIDRHWLHATVFTLVLVGLVVVAMGADLAVALTALAVCSVGFGFFYVVFTGGAHFGLTVANSLAVYACLFEFFRESNFLAVDHTVALVALILPVLAFLGACFLRRRRIAAAIQARRSHRIPRLPAMRRWLPGLIAIGAASFATPRFALGPDGQALWLLASMALIGALVALAVRDVVMLLVDIALIFEDVAARLEELVTPVLAFLTYYSLLVVLFTCLYRIADASLGGNQFLIFGKSARLSFGEAFYFSLVTITTVGYGDITPHGPLVRGLAAIEVLMGLLLLLFGFSEIMRSRARHRDPPAP